jgi:DNA repair exonuclease SbcCD nuclease subunit
MKLLLLSDIHLGVKNNSDFFLNVIKDYFLKEIIPSIQRNKIDQLWILGDFFDNRYNINVLIENTGINIIKKILKEFPNLKINMIIGNHDIYYKNSLKVNSLRKFANLHKNLKVISTVESFDLDGCKVLAVPWLIEGSENHTEFRKVIEDYKDTGNKRYDWCFGHFEINGFEVVKNVVHQHGLAQSDFKAFDQVYSGHFHIRCKQGNIQYLGSPYEINWNDHGDIKGHYVLDTDTKKVSFFENTLSPKHVHVNVSSIQKDRDILKNIPKQFIKLHIDTDIDESALNDLLTSVENSLPTLMQVIDERYDLEIKNEDIKLDGLIESDALQYALEYVDSIQFDKSISIDEMKKRIIYVYNTVVKDSE